MRDARQSFYLGTAIDGVQLNSEQLHVRDRNLNDLLGTTTYTQALFHILRGRMPDQQEQQLFDLVLVAFHGGFGLLPPTTLVPRLVAGTGVPVAQALAAGYLASGPYHVGAVEHSMVLYSEIAAEFQKQFPSEDATAGQLEQFAFDYTSQILQRGETVPGYGHPLLRKDPRPTHIRRILIEMNVESAWLQIFDGVVRCLLERKNVVPNVDGITAAILLTLGFTPEHGTGLFLLGRTAGMLAHVVEERTQMPYQTMKRFMILPIAFPRLFNSNSRRLAVLFNKLRDHKAFQRLQNLLSGRGRRELQQKEAQDLAFIASHRQRTSREPLGATLQQFCAQPAAVADRFATSRKSIVDEPEASDSVDRAEGLNRELDGYCSPELLVGAACFLSASLERLHNGKRTASSDSVSAQSQDLLRSALKLVEQAATLAFQDSDGPMAAHN
ncbi:MAG: hypothetical protein KDA85_10615 [Planctomycetaceae bacterium]|nr:hypothetical protein [Planctomycetaceae bacterium]